MGDDRLIDYPILVIALITLGLPWLLTSQNYLLFHSIAELFSIIIAFSIFVVSWNTRKYHEGSYFMFLGIAFLFVAVLDLLHTLAYKGIGIFNTTNSNLATQLWVSARFVQSISLLVVPFIVKRKVNITKTFIIYTLVFIGLLLSIFYFNIFPTAYIEGQGLTVFKIASEYLIIGILAAAMHFMYRKRKNFEFGVYRLFMIALGITIISEFSFTLYTDVYGILNIIGHILKILAFYYIYKALIQIGLTKPHAILFKELKESEESMKQERNRAQKYLDVAGVMLVIVNKDEKVRLINKKGAVKQEN